MRTYKTTWVDYERWHIKVTGVAVPRCPITGLIWTDARQATHYMTHAAACGRTIQQMTSARSALNWLINSHHTMRSTVVEGLGTPSKITSSDSVRIVRK